jgi:hypothetical protein
MGLVSIAFFRSSSHYESCLARDTSRDLTNVLSWEHSSKKLDRFLTA